MKRRVFGVMALVFGLGLLRFGALAIERRPQRASNTLRRELLALEHFTPPRKPLEPVIEGSSAELLANANELSPQELLRAPHARHGGAPAGMATGTTGPGEVFLSPETLVPRFAELLKTPEITQCFEALALGSELTNNTGTHGFAFAEQLTFAVIQPCSVTFQKADSQTRDQAAAVLESIRLQAPTLAQAFREEDLHQQLKVFGGWMRAVDRDALPEAAQKLAGSAKQRAPDFMERQKLTSTWLGMTKASRQAIDALSLKPGDRDSKLSQLHDSLTTPLNTEFGLRFDWPLWLQHHERRLDAIEQLELMLQILKARDASATWPSLSDRDSGDFEFKPLDDTRADLRSKSTGLSLTLTHMVPAAADGGTP